MTGRRTFLRGMIGAPLAAAASLYLPAAGADAAVETATPTGFGGYIFNGGDADVQYAYMFTGPSSRSEWLGNIPVGTPLFVTGVGNGEMLDPQNSMWYLVQGSFGSGWVYSGLVTTVAPVTVPAEAVALPPGPFPGPAGRGYGRSISISLSRQHLYAYDGMVLVYDTVTTTGDPDLPTPTGLYAVQKKIRNFVFHSPWQPGSPYWYPDSPTNYAMLFREGGYFIHDAPWRPYYGPGTNFPHLDPDGVVRQGSHGCVNVPFGAASFLFTWAGVGTPVMIIA